MNEGEIIMYHLFKDLHDIDRSIANLWTTQYVNAEGAERKTIELKISGLEEARNGILDQIRGNYPCCCWCCPFWSSDTSSNDIAIVGGGDGVDARVAEGGRTDLYRDQSRSGGFEDS